MLLKMPRHHKERYRLRERNDGTIERIPRIPGKWSVQDHWSHEWRARREIIARRNAFKRFSKNMVSEPENISDLDDAPLAFTADQEEMLKQTTDFFVHGDKEIHESAEFKQLMESLSEKQASKKPVTKQEIDWLVEKLT